MSNAVSGPTTSTDDDKPVAARSGGPAQEGGEIGPVTLASDVTEGVAGRAIRAALEWMAAELPGRIEVDVERRTVVVAPAADSPAVAAFAAAVLDVVAGAEHPMRRFGELAAGGPIVDRLGAPPIHIVAAPTAPESATPPSGGDAPRAAPAPTASAPRVLFEWIGPIESGPAVVSPPVVAQAAPAPAPAQPVPPGVAPMPTPAASREVAFAFAGLPDIDSSELFDVWLIDAGDDPARTAAVIASVVGLDANAVAERLRALPAVVRAGTSAREVRRIEASLRYTTRARFEARVSTGGAV